MAFLAPWPVVIPLLMAALLVGTGPLLSRRVLDSLGIATTAVVVILCGLLLWASQDEMLIYWFGGWRPRGSVVIGICFAIDAVGAGLALLTAVLMLAALVFSWRYFKEIGPLYQALMLVFLAGMVGFCLTGDLFNLFVFFELMSVSAFALTAYKIEEEKSLAGGLNFAVINSLAGFLILFGVALLYGRTGALNLAQIGQELAHRDSDGLLLISLALILSGFFIKAALVPFHFWLADAHAVAPTPVCVLFSGVMVELGLYGAARVFWTVFDPSLAGYQPGMRSLLLGMGLVTIVVGAIMCHGQRHLKRLLAFSTISHAGMMLVGFALLTPAALAGAGIYILGHGLIKGALFLCAGILLHRFSSVDILELQGRGREYPYTGTVLLLGALGLAGAPPFGTFRGKALIEEAAAQQGHAWIIPILLLGSIITAAAVLRAAGRIFLDWGDVPDEEESAGPTGEEKPETRQGRRRIPWVMFAPAAMLAALALLLGVCPGLAEQTELHMAAFRHPQAYAAMILEGVTTGPPREEAAASGAALTGILYGLLSTAGAVGLALMSLFPHQLPKPLHRFSSASSTALLRPLRALHSGKIGDYVLWLCVGVTIFGLLLATLSR